jgi:Tn7-like transposition protein D/TniQ
VLAYFPTLYCDELLYSWFARYHVHSTNVSPKQTKYDLSSSKFTAVPDLPSNLRSVFEGLKHFDIPNLDSWIIHHTLFRYYTTFLNEEMRRKVYMTMDSGNHSGAIHALIGIMASAVKENQYFRFCPKCFQEDISTKGEVYWYTFHQIPGVYICLKHSVCLHDSTAAFRNKDKYMYVAASEEHCSISEKSYTYSEKTMELFKILAYQIKKIMEQGFSFTMEEIFNSYKYLLQLKGYTSVNGRVNQRKLTEQFQLFYGEEFLNSVQSPVGENSESCWLREITRKHRKSFHPIRHILLIYFLGEEINTFYRYAKGRYLPFGEGPYYCLNPAAEHYQKQVISNVEISICSTTKRPVGTFHCSCGFIYSRRGPDMGEEDKFKIGRVKDFGMVWRQKLQYLIEVEKKSYHAVSKELACDIATVKKYSQDDEKKAINIEERASGEVLALKKKQWLELMKLYPTKTITELRKSGRALYMWHYRYNLVWLKEVSPKSDLKRTPYAKVDWNKRDEDILIEVKNAIRNLKAIKKPIHINVSRIGKEIGKLSILEKHLEKLTKTQKYLSEHLETRESYRIRRVKWACQFMFEQNNQVVEWRIIRLAGLKDTISKNVRNALEEEIAKYSH